MRSYRLKDMSVKPLELSDVPEDLRPVQSVEIIERKELKNIGLGELPSITPNVEYGTFLSYAPVVVITLGAFVTIYMIVKEMNRSRR